jgi:hypothetical protein
VYGDKGLTELQSAMWSIYLLDPGVDRKRLIFISSCHTTKIHIPSFPTFELTLFFQDLVDAGNCVDPHGRVVMQCDAWYSLGARSTPPPG